MADTGDDISTYLVDPARRGIIPLAGFHVSRRLARTLRSTALQVRIDTAFEAVITACAEPVAGRPRTWINREIHRLCLELFHRGQAHSVEAWLGDTLVGGLYGVGVGGVFFGESMFSRVREASKVSLAHLVARLRIGGYDLLDTQFLTDHLAGFGAVEIARVEYRRRLTLALALDADFQRLQPYPTGEAVLQAINQAS